jgi:hypothetical protein
MRKKVFCGIAAWVMIAAVAAWNVYVNQSKNEMALSDVALENVKALAKEDSEPSPLCPNGCVSHNSASCFCYTVYYFAKDGTW